MDEDVWEREYADVTAAEAAAIVRSPWRKRATWEFSLAGSALGCGTSIAVFGLVTGAFFILWRIVTDPGPSHGYELLPLFAALTIGLPLAISGWQLMNARHPARRERWYVVTVGVLGTFAAPAAMAWREDVALIVVVLIAVLGGLYRKQHPLSPGTTP